MKLTTKIFVMNVIQTCHNYVGKVLDCFQLHQDIGHWRQVIHLSSWWKRMIYFRLISKLKCTVVFARQIFCWKATPNWVIQSHISHKQKVFDQLHHSLCASLKLLQIKQFGIWKCVDVFYISHFPYSLFSLNTAELLKRMGASTQLFFKPWTRVSCYHSSLVQIHRVK